MTGPDKDESFATFFKNESEGLRRFAVFLTGDAEAGAELAQEALVRTYVHWGRIRNANAAPYARKALVNLVRGSHRRSVVAKRFLAKQRSSDQVVPSSSDRVDDWLTISHALSRLSPVQRATIVLRYYEDMPEAEIGWVLDRSVGTVKSDIHRALKKLRPLLAPPAGKGLAS